MPRKEKLLVENYTIIDKKRKQELECRQIEVLGLKLFIPRSVVSPLDFNDCQFFALKVLERQKSLDKMRGSFLEIGAGSGIASIFLAQKSQLEIFSTDINPEATNICKINAAENGIDNNRFHCFFGNLFAPIPKGKKFDSIYWNHPWVNKTPPLGDYLDIAAYDPNYKYLKQFLFGARNYLTNNSKSEILLGTSLLADIDLILEISKNYGYNSKCLFRENKQLSPLSNNSLELMLLSFSLKNS